MSLAFALMAAINGSTGSSAKLSHGLKHPHQALPTSVRRPPRFSLLRGGGASRPRSCRTNPAHRILFVRSKKSRLAGAEVKSVASVLPRRLQGSCEVDFGARCGVLVDRTNAFGLCDTLRAKEDRQPLG